MKQRELKVNDIMSTALITVRERDTISDADIDMRLAGIRHLPVIDERGHVIGIVSNRDILRALGKGTRKAVVISEVMQRHVYTVHPDSAAHIAANKMLKHRIGSLPVVGDEAQLVGLVTETDLLRVAYEALSGHPFVD